MRTLLEAGMETDKLFPGVQAIAEKEVHTPQEQPGKPVRLSPRFNPVQKHHDTRRGETKKWKKSQKVKMPDQNGVNAGALSESHEDRSEF